MLGVWWPTLRASLGDPHSEHRLVTHTPSIAWWPTVQASLGDPHSEYRLVTHTPSIAWWPTLRASLGDPHSEHRLVTHTPSIAWWPTVQASLGDPHSEYRLVTHTPSIAWWPTLRASLSGTFLQTLPDLVTPPKGQSPHCCPPTRSAPSERFGYWWDCGSNLAPKQARKHEMQPPRIKKRKKKKKKKKMRVRRLDSNDSFWFYMGWVSNMET